MSTNKAGCVDRVALGPECCFTQESLSEWVVFEKRAA